jgi:excisionase family DNA binding protein
MSKPIEQPTSADVVGILHAAGIYVLKPKEAAKLLRVSGPAIYRAAKSKSGVRAHRFGGAMRFLVKDVFANAEEYQGLVNASRAISKKTRRVCA